jgi:hypothetical protein
LSGKFRGTILDTRAGNHDQDTPNTYYSHLTIL